MSDYGPPSADDIRAFKSKLSRTADWVSNHSSAPVSPASSPSSTPRPASSRSNSYTTSHHSSSRQLPPLPAGFAYASPGTPVSYTTSSATYYVVPPGQPIQVDGNNVYYPSSHHRSRRHSSSHGHHHHSSSSKRTSSTSSHAPAVKYVNTPSPAPIRPSIHHSHTSPHPAYMRPSQPGNGGKEKPLLQKLFGLGAPPHDKRPNSSKRSHSTDSGITIAW